MIFSAKFVLKYFELADVRKPFGLKNTKLKLSNPVTLDRMDALVLFRGQST